MWGNLKAKFEVSPESRSESLAKNAINMMVGQTQKKIPRNKKNQGKKREGGRRGGYTTQI